MSDSEPKKRLALAASALKQIPGNDLRFSVLASQILMARAPADHAVDKNGEFAKIIGAIDKMVAALHAEEDADILKKDNCDKERSSKTATAKEFSKDIDKNNARIEELTSSIASHNEQIKGMATEISELQEDLRDAKNNREVQHSEYQASRLDDMSAKSLVEQAYGVLKDKFDSLAGTSLLETRVSMDPGAPPPETFEGEYKGAQGASKGILAILETIKEDIQHDMDKSKKEEDDSVAAYAAYKLANEKTQQEKKDLVGTMEGQIADFQEEIGNKKDEVGADTNSLQGTLDVLKEITPGCDFIATQIETRVDNRNAELDGLHKAKAILQGANFR